MTDNCAATAARLRAALRALYTRNQRSHVVDDDTRRMVEEALAIPVSPTEAAAAQIPASPPPDLVVGALHYAAPDDVALFATRNQRWAVHRDMTYAYAGNVCFGYVEGTGLRAVFVPVEQWPSEWREPRLLPKEAGVAAPPPTRSFLAEAGDVYWGRVFDATGDGVFYIRTEDGEVWSCRGDARDGQRVWFSVQQGKVSQWAVSEEEQ